MFKPYIYTPVRFLFLLILIVLIQDCGKKKADKDITLISPLVETKATELLDDLLKSGKGYDTLIKKDDAISLSLRNNNYHVMQELLSKNLTPQAAGYNESMKGTYLEIAVELKKSWERLLINKIIEFEIIEIVKSECNVKKFDMEENLRKICGGDFTESSDSLNKIYKIFRLSIEHLPQDYSKANTPRKLIDFITGEVNEKIF